jgi:isoaspartyl peptidase/L-asparaginase-like protein (Ntn-hydrolase superfamily)
LIRAGAARPVAALVEHGSTLQSAADAALTVAAECGGSGGLIAVDCPRQRHYADVDRGDAARRVAGRPKSGHDGPLIPLGPLWRAL